MRGPGSTRRLRYVGIVRIAALRARGGEVRVIAVDTGIEKVTLAGFERMDEIFASLAEAAGDRVASASPAPSRSWGLAAATWLVVLGGLAAALVIGRSLGFSAGFLAVLGHAGVLMLIGIAFVTLHPISRGGWNAPRRIDDALGGAMMVVAILQAVLDVVRLSS